MKPKKTSMGSVLRYVACGDSGAVGTGASVKKNAYAYRIADALRMEHAIFYKNTAVNGEKTRNFIRQQLPAVIAANPDIVVLSIGINDMFYMRSQRYVLKNLRFIFSELRQKTRAQIFMASMPDITGAQFFPLPYVLFFNWRAQKINAALKAFEDKRVHVVDIYNIDWTDIGGREHIFARDGLHLHDIGHKEIARTFLKAMVQRL